MMSSGAAGPVSVTMSTGTSEAAAAVEAFLANNLANTNSVVDDEEREGDFEADVVQETREWSWARRAVSS